MPGYPTETQILADPQPTYKPEVLRFVREWKRTFVGRRRTREAIVALLSGLGDLYRKPVRIEFISYAILVGGMSDPVAGVIYLPDATDGFSILTALHEFGHHRFGASELKACRWSVGLFRKVFPRTFARAHFEGHMLVLNRPRLTGTGMGIADQLVADLRRHHPEVAPALDSMAARQELARAIRIPEGGTDHEA
jgi:hypothetical protein